MGLPLTTIKTFQSDDSILSYLEELKKDGLLKSPYGMHLSDELTQSMSQTRRDATNEATIKDALHRCVEAERTYYDDLEDFKRLQIERYLHIYCGHVPAAVLHITQDESYLSRDYKVKFSDMYRSFCSERNGERRSGQSNGQSRGQANKVRPQRKGEAPATTKLKALMLMLGDDVDGDPNPVAWDDYMERYMFYRGTYDESGLQLARMGHPEALMVEAIILRDLDMIEHRLFNKFCPRDLQLFISSCAQSILAYVRQELSYMEMQECLGDISGDARAYVYPSTFPVMLPRQ